MGYAASYVLWLGSLVKLEDSIRLESVFNNE